MAKKQRVIKPYNGFQENFVRSNLDFVVGGGAMSGGKMCPLDTLVLTPNGWKENGMLRVGDYVCTPFGLPSRILAVFDHKNKDIYEVKTEDGRKCECGLEHLWSYKIGNDAYKEEVTDGLETGELSDIISLIDNGSDVFIPIAMAVMFKRKEYALPPFTLGMLLADGGMSQYVGILSDEEQGYICNIGLDCESNSLFIPEEYLFGSIVQRSELLTGIVDRCGHLDAQNRPHIYVKSKRLSNDILYLCRSLGYIAYADIEEGLHHICILT